MATWILWLLKPGNKIHKVTFQPAIRLLFIYTKHKPFLFRVELQNLITWGQSSTMSKSNSVELQNLRSVQHYVQVQQKTAMHSFIREGENPTSEILTPLLIPLTQTSNWSHNQASTTWIQTPHTPNKSNNASNQRFFILLLKRINYHRCKIPINEQMNQKLLSTLNSYLTLRVGSINLLTQSVPVKTNYTIQKIKTFCCWKPQSE